MKDQIHLQRRDSLGRTRQAASDAGAKRPAKGDLGPNLVCPECLDSIGRDCWHAIVEHLRKTGTLDTGDSAALTLFASTWEDFHEARADVKARGMSITTLSDRGTPQERVNPSCSVMATARSALQSQMANLGIGPRNRSAVMPASEPEDPNADFKRLLGGQ